MVQDVTETYLSLRQVVELTEIPENSCKRYMLEHEEFVNFHKEHNRFRVHISAVEVLKTIRQLYADGYKREAVDEYLRSTGVPVTITMDSEDDRKPLINLNQEVAELKRMVKQDNERMQAGLQAVLQELHKVRKENADLKHLLNRTESDAVKSLRQSLDDKPEEAEEPKKEYAELLAKFDALEEQLKQVQQPEKKGIFSRIFSK